MAKLLKYLREKLLIRNAVLALKNKMISEKRTPEKKCHKKETSPRKRGIRREIRKKIRRPDKNDLG